MKIYPDLLKKHHLTPERFHGFALVVTLSLMILLTVIAVGLLSLSSISLRASSLGSAAQTAKANARLALILAIGDLQTQMGPDQRISAPADQRSSGDGSSTSAAIGNRHWTGAFDSWLETASQRPSPNFRRWLVSGDSNKVTSDTAPDSPLTGSDFVQLVGEGTLGTSNSGGQVNVPALKLTGASGKTARLAWWIGDQGVKAAIATPPPPTESSFAALRQTLQGAPRNGIGQVSIGSNKPFDGLDPDDDRIGKVTSWQQAAFLTTNTEAPRELFHDLAAFSTGLLTNVRAGGFRRDLSMKLEQPSNAARNSVDTPLYRVGGENGINLDELRSYYNVYKELSTTGTAKFTTGGTISRGIPYLSVERNADTCRNDEYFYYKQPVIINYQMVFSLEARTTGTGRSAITRLHLVADPILTFWNPLDVPVVIPKTAYISVKWWQIPYTFDIFVNGVRRICPVLSTLSGAQVDKNTDGNFVTLKVGKVEQIVMKPGEVLKCSQSGNSIVRTSFNRFLDGKSGFNYGGGLSLPMKDLNGAEIRLGANDTVTYTAAPNQYTAGKDRDSGHVLDDSAVTFHSRHFSVTHNEYFVGEDRNSNSLGVGTMSVDWDFGDKRLRPGQIRADKTPGTKRASERLYANKYPEVFKPITEQDTRPLGTQQLLAGKAPVMMFGLEIKTELGSDTQTRFLSRFNPKALHVDFYDLSQSELDSLPYEIRIEPLVSWKNRSLEVSTNGNAYFGGGLNAESGTSIVTTHSVPREPIVSLASFQHSFANGFETQKPVYGYATLNTREPMLPQISHAIGNSLAPPMLASDETEGSLSGGRPLADHSYLANQALWDDWFLSGIAPQSSTTFAATRSQRNVASDFFGGDRKLPVVRYLPELGGKAVTDLLSDFFSGSRPSDKGVIELASHLRVDGMFNVNSTSVEAWKAVLGALKGRQVIIRDLNGKESIAAIDAETPVQNLTAPMDLIAQGNGNVDVLDQAQWAGRRTLDDDDIISLAEAIVKQVRKRGPFLNLGDFVNRRVGSDKELARAGAIQAALDAEDVKINDAFNSSRAVSTATASRFTFPEAEEGPMAYGAPGIVKQADVLTPIAPILSARSDSFIIRAYGESVDAAGKVNAKAWCEAVVERDRNFVDPNDDAETVLANLNQANSRFGRRFQLISFRWLNPSEI